MPKKLLFIVNQDRYFVSHRLHLAKLAIDKGFKVGLICNVSNYADDITFAGIELFQWKLSRGSINPFFELYSLYQLFKIIIKFKPDIVHAVALKSVIYSAIVSKFIRFNSIYALGGLGFIFSSTTNKALFLKIIVSKFLKILINKKSNIILQNPDDIELLLSFKIVSEGQIKLIRGAGVDVNYFSSKPIKNNLPRIILPARMLWDKGVGDFICCAKHINKSFKKAEFILVGDTDNDNPKAISEEQLMAWHNDGVIKWLGYQSNMIKIYNKSDIVCFPSYREGLPKSLLEAASCELPIVAYDVPGCREIVLNNINGLLIENQNQEKLFIAIQKLIDDVYLRKKLGKNGRKLVINHFSQEQIGAETLNLWNKELN